jgi:hypothetical protein
MRPVPWRRMAGATWRQHRIALAGSAVLLGALAVWLWITGATLHHAYAAAFGAVVSWYFQPEFGRLYETSPLVTLFGLREVTFPAWTLVPARALPGSPGHHQQQLQSRRQHRVDHRPVVDQERQVHLLRQSTPQPPQPVLLFPSAGEGGRPGWIRAVPNSARLHAVDQLSAGYPVLAIPADRGWLA